MTLISHLQEGGGIALSPSYLEVGPSEASGHVRPLPVLCRGPLSKETRDTVYEEPHKTQCHQRGSEGVWMRI